VPLGTDLIAARLPRGARSASVLRENFPARRRVVVHARAAPGVRTESRRGRRTGEGQRRADVVTNRSTSTAASGLPISRPVAQHVVAVRAWAGRQVPPPSEGPDELTRWQPTCRPHQATSTGRSKRPSPLSPRPNPPADSQEPRQKPHSLVVMSRWRIACGPAR